MSFSSRTKNELSRLEMEKNCCAYSELSAMTRMNGTIQIKGNNNISLKYSTENAAIARRIFSLLKTLYNTSVEVMVRRNQQLNKNNNYIVYVANSELVNKILNDIGFDLDFSDINFIVDYKIPEKFITNRCCRRAYIRGSFLGGGSISNPEKAYHMEFVTNSSDYGDNLSDLINSFGLNSKVIERKGNSVVYIKEGSQIADLLNIMGAHQALLKFEDIRVFKDVRNNINRIVNCETANLGKTIDASLRQVTNINFIEDTVGIDKLPENLQELAYLRLENRNATLKELGEKLNPPVGKSGVNHRFRKIDEIAERLREKKAYKNS